MSDNDNCNLIIFTYPGILENEIPMDKEIKINGIPVIIHIYTSSAAHYVGLVGNIRFTILDKYEDKTPLSAGFESISDGCFHLPTIEEYNEIFNNKDRVTFLEEAKKWTSGASVFCYVDGYYGLSFYNKMIVPKWLSDAIYYETIDEFNTHIPSENLENYKAKIENFKTKDAQICREYDIYYLKYDIDNDNVKIILLDNNGFIISDQNYGNRPSQEDYYEMIKNIYKPVIKFAGRKV